MHTTFYDVVLFALKRYKLTHSIYLGQVVLNLLLDLILVPRMGVSGAAVATAVAYLCRAVVTEVYMRRYLGDLVIR